MIGKPFDHMPLVLYIDFILYATKKRGTAHDFQLDEQRDAMIEANEPRLVYLARHLATPFMRDSWRRQLPTRRFQAQSRP
jgi:hypothetical protein